jgi:hypothetical protein
MGEGSLFHLFGLDEMKNWSDYKRLTTPVGSQCIMVCGITDLLDTHRNGA